VLKAAVAEFSQQRVGTMAGALAYFTFFSIAPMVIVVIAVAGLVFGHEAASGALSQHMQGLVGADSAEAIESLVQSASGKRSGTLATIIGAITIIFGATGVFSELQESLNKVWKAPPLKINKVVGFFRTRFLSFSVVLGVGFLLLVSLLISVAISSVCSWMGRCDELVGRVTEWTAGFAITTLLFALIFKLLPDVKVSWRHVWQGALVTAVLFTIGKSILGYVMGNTGVLSTYGAAASLAALLLWVYYSSMILLFGAEISYVIATRAGEKPEEHVDAPWAEGHAEPSH
jgi:membrane protein